MSQPKPNKKSTREISSSETSSDDELEEELKVNIRSANKKVPVLAKKPNATKARNETSLEEELKGELKIKAASNKKKAAAVASKKEPFKMIAKPSDFAEKDIQPPKPKNYKFPDYWAHGIVLKNLAPTVTYDDIWKMIPNHENIPNIAILKDLQGNPTETGFVRCLEESSFERVMLLKEFILKGKPVAMESSAIHPLRMNSIYIGPLDPKLTELEIRRALDDYSLVVDIRLPKDLDSEIMRTALVTFEEAKDVEKLLEQGNVVIQGKSVGVAKSTDCL